MKKTTVCKVSTKPPIVKYTGLVDETITITSSTEPHKGPIVEGWGPEVSRNVKLYVRPEVDTVLLAPQNLGNDPLWCTSTKLFIFQHTRPSNFAIRLDNRRTWMNYLKVRPYLCLKNKYRPNVSLLWFFISALLAIH